FPVVPCPGGPNPGQNRDNSWRLIHPWSAFLGVAILGVLLIVSMSASASSDSPPGPRTPEQIERDRQARWDRPWAEVRRIATEFHALLPREQAESIGAAYARYSSRFQDSVPDQLRGSFAAAVRLRIFIPLDQIYIDLAVRGSKNNRDGLNR